MTLVSRLNKITSLQRKIALIAGLCLGATVIVIVVLSAIMSVSSQRFVTSEVGGLVSGQAKTMLQNRAAVEAGGVKEALDVAFDAARTNAQSFSVLAGGQSGSTPSGQRRAQFNAILRRVLDQNPGFNGTYSAWEPNAIDGADAAFGGNTGMGSDNTGRYLPYWTRSASGGIAIQPLVEYDSASQHPNGLVKGSWYLGPRANGKESILGPLPYTVQGKRVFLATMSVPIVIGGRFVGVSGADYDLDFLQKVAVKTNSSLFSGKGVVLIVSDTGLVVANSSNPDTIGKPAAAADPHWTQLPSIVGAGQAKVVDDEKQPNIDIYSPIKLGRSTTPWSVVISVPRELVLAQADALDDSLGNRAISSLILQLVLGFGVAVAAIFGISRAAKGIARPIRDCAEFANGIAREEFDQSLNINQADEVGTLADALRKMQGDIKNNVEHRAVEREKTEFVVKVLSENLNELSQGDLTSDISVEFSSEYGELKTNYNSALGSLRALIGSVGESTQSIKAGSNEIAQASEDLAQRTEGNAASLEETSAALVQIESRLRATATAAQSTVARADQAMATVNSGRSTADTAMQAMGRVSESAKGIDGVIEGLDKIAFQTRVLAMNAAVEAGRAGEAGRGFAVVADLVSALAIRAEEEAKRARDQLGVTQIEIISAVSAVGTVDTAFVAISADVSEVNGLLAGMASDNQAQSMAISEITAAISMMDQATQQNAAMVEETSAAARNLTQEVGNLASAAAQFTLDSKGRVSSNSGSRVAAGRSPYVQPKAYSSTIKPLPAAAIPALVRTADDWKEF